MYFPKQKSKNNSDSIYLEVNPYKYTKRANRFLEIQEGRIIKLIQEKQYTKATFIWLTLLKSSSTYQTCLMNRVIPSWYYRFTIEEVRKFQMEVKRKLRSWNLQLTLKRFYLDKGMERTGVPNGKFRPIGAPTLVSRVISKAFNDMVYFIMEDGFELFQHGYRLDRGCYSALYEVWERIFVKNQREIYEFDFQAFFNTVSRSSVWKALAKRSHLLADTIFSIIRNITYQFDELKPEKELVKKFEVMDSVKNSKGEMEMKYKDMIVRNGLPQGLSISPLLATLVLENSGAPVQNLVMYADDGLVFSPKGMYGWFERLSKMGIRVAPEKTGKLGNEFKFLGTFWNIEEETVRYNDSVLRWTEMDKDPNANKERIKKWFKHVASIYGNKPSDWTWEINDESWAMKNKAIPTSHVDRALTIWNGVRSGSMWKGWRYFLGKGTFNISQLSSQCCDALLKYKHEERYKKVIIEEIPDYLKRAKKIVAVMKEINPDRFKKEKLVLGYKGRTLVKSCARKVVINGEFKYQGNSALDRFNLLHYSKYFELPLPFDNRERSDVWMNEMRTNKSSGFPKRTYYPYRVPMWYIMQRAKSGTNKRIIWDNNVW